VPPFRDLRDYVAIPKLTALRLSPDGTWLAAAVQTVDADGKKFASSIWRIDASPDGTGRPASRLTRSGSWRWNPWLMAERGYAVLLPDPALSTGYGHDFIACGHGRWGEEPFTDVMAITDAAVARPDIDAARTAMMGGSFGGYMANWIAGHTGRAG
jgi:dipeptidyl aminopeptidase/acylaminoacyl peptidase